MGQRSHLLLSMTIMLVPSSGFAAGPCATCAKQVDLSKTEVKCVIERVTKQLSSSLDPVVVATNGCGKVIRDGTRSEAVRQGRRSTLNSERKVDTPYLLTKADALCLIRKLKQADPKARELRIDLTTCG